MVDGGGREALGVRLAQIPIDTTRRGIQTTIGQVPPRFAKVRFETYQAHPNFPSQQAALRLVQEYVRGLTARSAKRWAPRIVRRRSVADSPWGLYLDGGFGVGKTHLLASAFCEAPDPKAYLSFAELMYMIAWMGMQESVQTFSGYRFIAIDEFELDDPASTRMGAMFLTKLKEAKGGGPAVVATSNTPPHALGQGRFSASDFQREIGALARHFETVTIDGQDYRMRQGAHGQAAFQPSHERLVELFHREPLAHPKIYTRFEELLDHLAQLHPMRFVDLVRGMGALYIDGVSPIVDQASALRFVHFVDKAYDRELPLFATATCSLEELFPETYRYNGYEKKYGRATSRLGELLQESMERITQDLARESGLNSGFEPPGFDGSYAHGVDG